MSGGAGCLADFVSMIPLPTMGKSTLGPFWLHTALAQILSVPNNSALAFISLFHPLQRTGFVLSQTLGFGLCKALSLHPEGHLAGSAAGGWVDTPASPLCCLTAELHSLFALCPAAAPVVGSSCFGGESPL